MPPLAGSTRSAAVFQRYPAVVLRREAWGGCAFHRGSGDLLELDEAGFEIVARLSNANSLRDLWNDVTSECRRKRLPELAGFLFQLERCGFVRRFSSTCPPLSTEDWWQSFAGVPPKSADACQLRSLRAPLVAHWAVTYRCNLSCPFCYSESSPHRQREPAADVRRQIVQRLAEWGVFEVALGGGEPTILSDFAELLAEIRQCGMVPNITTNGILHNREIIQALSNHAGAVHLSADRADLLDASRGPGVFARLQETAKQLSDGGVRWGVNLLLTPHNAFSLDHVLTEMRTLGASVVTLLRPKGGWAARHWPNFPSEQDMHRISAALKKFIQTKPHLRLYVDTALRSEWSQAGLFDDPEPEVVGCGGGQRHAAITPEGNVYPCSHARQRELYMGNLLKGNLEQLWNAGLGSSARRRYSNLCQGAICPCRNCEQRIDANLNR